MDAFRHGHVSRFPTGLVECDDLFAVRALWHTGMISEYFLRKDQPGILEPKRFSRRLPAAHFRCCSFTRISGSECSGKVETANRLWAKK
jgi:hypothetical protein